MDIWLFLLKNCVSELTCVDAENSGPTGTLGEFLIQCMGMAPVLVIGN